MKGTWIKEANEIARQLKDMQGLLCGVCFDTDEKADAYVKYWGDKHPHVEIVSRTKAVGIIVMQIRLAGQLN